MKIKSLLKNVAVAAAMVVTAGVANAAACSVADVTFSATYPTGQAPADACSNALDGQGNTPNLSALETLWGAGFVEGATIGSAETGSATGGTVLGGFQFTLSGVGATTSGVYSLSIQDMNGATAPNLPYFLDFVLYLKGGNADTAAYLFDDTFVDTLGGGAWTITFLNNGGNMPALSNISVWVREGTGPVCTPPEVLDPATGQCKEPPSEVPEPGTIALLGLGLLGLGIARRRRA